MTFFSVRAESNLTNVPTPLAAQAYWKAANSVTFNPTAATLNDFDQTVGKVFCLTCRLVYMIAVGVLIAPLGAIYHAGASIIYKIQADQIKTGEEKDRCNVFAKEHLNAAITDLKCIGCIKGSTFLFDPTHAVAPLFNDVKIAVPINEGKQKICSLQSLVESSLLAREDYAGMVKEGIPFDATETLKKLTRQVASPINYFY